MTDQRIAGLDGIRAIAVLLVFASHTNNVANKLQFGTMGVWAFFVLSGFLIVRILHQERLAIEFHRTKFVAAIGNFFKRRTVRIFPIYYLVLGLAALLTLSGPVLNYSGAPWPFYWAYISNIYIQIFGAHPGSFTHLWSLAIEEQFYLISAPLFLLVPARYGVAICLAFISIGILRGLFLIGGPETNYADSVFNFYMLGLGGLTGLSVAGVRPAQASVGAVALTLVVLAAMTADFLLRGSTSRSVLAFPFFMASIYVFIFQNQTSLLVRALDFGPIRGLGRISYGFYLYHNFVKLEWIRPLIGISFEPSNKIRVAIEFLITLLVAVLSWFVIERPLLRRFSRPHLISNSLETIQQASQPAQ